MALLAGRNNAIGVILGTGWYNCHTADVWHFDKASWRDYPKLLLELEIGFADGSTQTVVSNSTWQVSDSALVFDGLRNGETYDARLEQTGWDTAGFEAAGWKNAAVVAGPGGALFEQSGPACRVVDTLKPKDIREIETGVWVFDFGQNIAGWAQLHLEGEAGTEIKMVYAEKVNFDGSVDQGNINSFIKSGDCQTDRYILRGGGPESYEPRFTYHGFQWVEVHGLPYPPTADTLRARVVQSDFPSAGQFNSSSETLNSLQRLTLWSYRGNFVGIPTDCPHREKNGWTGDAQLAVETGLFNFDASAAYAHWIGTVADAQRGSGQLPGIVPSAGWGFNWGNGPAWDSAFILIPWQIYVFTGDWSLLRDHYQGMKQYVHFVAAMLDDGLVKYGLGDWVPPRDVRTSPAQLCTTAIFGEDCRVLARIATLLGHTEDAAAFQALGRHIRNDWRRHFLQPDGGVAGNEQTSLGCALYHDLLEANEIPLVLAKLLRAVEASNGRPAFGILGAKWVTRVLADHGHADVAYEMIAGAGYPGWAHWLEQGATTLWEDWEGQSSRNHIMFGDISAWMYTYLAGIKPQEAHPGFERFTIAPLPVRGLEWASAEHKSPHGLIKSLWRRHEHQIIFEITIPEGTTADWISPDKPGISRPLTAGRHSFTIKEN